MCRIHLVFRTGALHTSTVQPKAGRSENIYWLCKVSLLLPPSSLGLDGQEQPIRRFEDIQEVPKEPSSPCSPFGFLVHSIVITIGERIWVLPFLNWLLSLRETSTSWMKKCQKLWLTNLMSLLIYALYRCKTVSQELPELGHT